MADKKITELTALTGANAATDDLFHVVDVSASANKKITRAEFFQSIPSVDINGGTIDGTVIGGSTPAAISGTTGSFSGNLTVDTDTLFVDAANNRVGIGTSSPSRSLHVDSGSVDIVALFESDTNAYIALWDGVGGAKIGNLSGELTLHTGSNDTGAGGPERLRITSTGNVGIGDTTPDVALDVVGDINYTGTITDVSDRRFKENVRDLTNSLDKICLLNAKSYTLIADRGNETTEVELGFIAQEVQPVFPEVVKEVQKFATDEKGKLTDEEVNYLGVSYIQLVAPMVEAIKELKAKNDALEARITALGG